jgi:alkylated DNA repair dioxygenase AlkB
MIEGVTYTEAFIEAPGDLYTFLEIAVNWDERMVARKTASYGKAYNYSQIEYPFQPFLAELEHLTERIGGKIGFAPNNCLINFYPDGKSKMGFHSDQTENLEAGTGIVIVSLGETRSLQFRNIADHSMMESYELHSGSLIYMTQDVQSLWQHAVPKANTDRGRMSLTFRRLK